MTAPPVATGLYDPRHEHDACGVGFVVDIKGRRSHAVVEQGLQVLVNLLHRGACGCEANTGDGAGVLIQVPDRFLRKVTAPLGITLPPAGEYGTGLVFLPVAGNERERLRALLEQTAAEEGLEVLGWRALSIDDRALGESARAARPVIEQIFIASRNRVAAGDTAAAQARLERKLYVVRKRVEHAADQLPLVERHAFYIPSLS
jgi:glutamate synthase (NADPH/NADH) large chain